jgi:hypothetical protein
MPKAKHKKGSARRNTTSIRPENRERDTSVTTSTATNTTTSRQTEQTGRANSRIAQRSEQKSRAERASSYQSLIMPAMVTLGCLGLAISFSFFTVDPNRFLYGGIAALMALMWAYSLWLRLRKIIRKEHQ